MEKAPLYGHQLLSQDNDDVIDSLSHLIEELEVFEAGIDRHFRFSLALLVDNHFSGLPVAW